ncbi:MAG TPA: FxsA family protein [Euzebyales bacterium]|nr:FxsA family protein [Euzebyales bacterium]
MRLVLVVAFIVVPLLELAIIIQVGDLIGAAPTILLLLAVSLAGAWLVRREGTRAWIRFTDALRSGRVPADEVLEGAMVLFGGALLLTPGFATDAVGLLLMIPPIRAVIAVTLKRRLGARFTVTSLSGTAGRRPPQARRRDEVVDVEVVNIERSGDRAGTGTTTRNGDIHSNGTGSA